MIKPESKRPITIEDLLRLKRAERPAAEFWNEFDRALRAKQLAALVEKRPWWQTMLRVPVGLRRYHIPIGAAAVVALSVFVIREYRGTDATTGARRSAEKAATTSLARPASVQPEAQNESAVDALRRETTNGLVANESREERSGATTLASDATSPGEISRILPLIGTSVAEARQEELSPSARAIAANLATVRGNEPVLARTLLSTATTSETRAARPTVEPLQQIASPADRRRSVLLTAMISATSFEMPSRSSERVATRLSQDELYDRIHRFGARGNAVNYKF